MNIFCGGGGDTEIAGTPVKVVFNSCLFSL